MITRLSFNLFIILFIILISTTMSQIKNKITFAKLNCTMYNLNGEWIVQKDSELTFHSTRVDALCKALGGNRSPFKAEKANRIIPV
jgi:hypothetical protein